MSTKEIENSLKFIRESKRASERFPYEGVVNVKIGTQSLKGECRNISLGGLFATFTGNIASGDFLTISLELPGVVDSSLKAKVVWVVPKDNKVGIGFKFISITDQIMKAIVALSANEELRDI
jgi:c-di-GMP-binding flagellar brake protein YcgR